MVQNVARQVRASCRALSDRRGVVALEFAILALPCMILMFGVIEIAFDMFVQESLDSAVDLAARSVQVGNARGTTGETSSMFAQNAVCPNLNGVLSCANLVVAVTPIPSGVDYWTNTNWPTFAAAGSASGSICTGIAGQLMLIEAWYTGPSFVAGLVPGFASAQDGTFTRVTYSSSGFVNEAFSGGQTGPGC